MEDNQNGPKPVGHALLSALDRLSASREAYVKRVEASALPGETFEQTEMRLRREQDQRDRARAAMPNGSIKPGSPSMIRKPPKGDEQPDFWICCKLFGNSVRRTPPARSGGARCSKAAISIAR